MSSLNNLLNEICRELREKEKTQEKAKADMRKARRLSKQAIFLIHQKRFDDANSLIRKAKKIISKLNDASTKDPKVVYGGMFDAALQEYSEANIFLRLIKESEFISPQQIDVPPIDYVLGLADVVGEYRRLALDSLREGAVRKSEECLEIMETIYAELMAVEEAHTLIRGLRRKCDIARRVIEATRGDVTQEVRRSALEKYLRSFEKLVRRSLSGSEK